LDPTARRSLARLEGLPAGPAVLDAADHLAGLWLVGGAVRDVLLDAPVRDVDIAVEGEIEPVVAALGDLVEGHGRFGTATVRTPDGGTVNVARTRAESYAHPGALPDVRPAGLDEDLRRRDFTINAIAVGLSGDVRGEVRAADHAPADIEDRLLRVLHDGSFADDPTRLLRLARYETRLGLAVEGRTATLARDATLQTVSGDRIGNEVRLLLAEPDPVRALAEGARYGPPVPAPDETVARAALALLPPGERPDLLVAASGGEGTEARLRKLGFTAPDARRGGRAARARELAAALRQAQRPSAIAAVARDWPAEAVALAGALGAEPQARAWLEDLRHVRLAIGGDDLLAAGVPEGPEIGARLARVLERRLDGELAPGREAELEAALASGG
jgi:tRNA nucleotidyltransferase (CCA-adding enzyme)